MMKNIQKRRIVRIREGRSSIVEDEIICDIFLNILLNGEQIVSFVCSPGYEDKAAIGYLFSTGILNSISKIERISHSGYNVYVQTSEEFLKPKLQPTFITSTCSVPEEWLKLRKGFKLPQVNSNLRVDATTIILAKKQLDKASVIYKRTGGTHAAALFSPDGNLLWCIEDISRHVAIDKILGMGLLEKIDLTKVVLVTTGRLASVIVAKAGCVGIPIVASISAPVNSGIQLAENLGITLVGFVRGKRMNIYTHPERILIE